MTETALPARGLIQPGAPDVAHGRIQPPEDLREIVRHFWWVRWDVPAPLVQENLPHPSIHLVFQNGEARLFGVPTGRFTVELSQRGQVFGVKFQPGAFFAVLKKPVALLTDRRLPADDVFGPDVRDLNDAVQATGDVEERTLLCAKYLRSLRLTVDEDTRLASRLVLRLETERDLLRVEDLCRSEGLAPRKVQRLFQRTVGVSPRWIISRYRLHEALERLRVVDHQKPDWVAFSLDLGYYDQAHFIKDFARMVGCTPEEYGMRRADTARR